LSAFVLDPPRRILTIPGPEAYSMPVLPHLPGA
jgi:hypothetical protein